MLCLKGKVLFFKSISERQNRTQFPVSVFLANILVAGTNTKASAAVWIRSAIFWDITQRRMVVSLIRFGETIFKGQAFGEKNIRFGLLDSW